jgi:hypothetical protein
VSAWDATSRADVVILTAIRLEFDAVLEVDAGTVPGSVWERAAGPNGLPVAFRSFEIEVLFTLLAERYERCSV